MESQAMIRRNSSESTRLNGGKHLRWGPRGETRRSPCFSRMGRFVWRSSRVFQVFEMRLTYAKVYFSVNETGRQNDRWQIRISGLVLSCHHRYALQDATNKREKTQQVILSRGDGPCKPNVACFLNLKAAMSRRPHAVWSRNAIASSKPPARKTTPCF